MNGAMIKAAAHFFGIKKREKNSGDKLRGYQFFSVEDVIRFAAERIPFYRENFKKNGFSPNNMPYWEDFRKIPLLSKSALRMHAVNEFLPEGMSLKNAWMSQTTGSSGIPITIYRNPESDAWNKALLHYSLDALGIRLHHRFCQILSMVPEKPNPPGFLAKMKLKRFFPVSLKQPDEDIIVQLNQIRPDVIYTFPSVLKRLAESLVNSPLKFRPRWLVSQGEILPDFWRDQIQNAFGASLYHTYGATEFPRVGFECRLQRGFHVITDAAVVEVLNENGESVMDQEGEIVLTHLHNFCMPLIRYRIGDRGILSSRPCPCGIRYPLLENVTGRMDDFLLLPSGRKVSARAVTHMQFKGILQYKIFQKSPAHFQVLVIPSVDFNEQTLDEIRRELLAGCLGEDIFIEVVQAETLPVSRSGKLQILTREF